MLSILRFTSVNQTVYNGGIMADTPVALSTALARLRKRAGLSVRQLEERSGVSRAIISKTENGSRLPTASTLQRLAAALEADGSALLTAAGYTAKRAEGLPSFRPYLRAKYGHLPKEKLAELSAFFETIEAEQTVKRSRKSSR